MGGKHTHAKIGLVQLRDPYNPEYIPQLPKGDFRAMFKKEHWYLGTRPLK
jgi:hypothetical protein